MAAAEDEPEDQAADGDAGGASSGEEPKTDGPVNGDDSAKAAEAERPGEGNGSDTLDLDEIAGTPTSQAPPPTSQPATGRSVPFTDKTRRDIALVLLFLLGIIIATSFGLLLWALADAKTKIDATDNFATINGWLNIVFGPVVTLVGSAVGFYFGSQSTKNGGATNPPGEGE